jgi:hypothetical protein
LDEERSLEARERAETALVRLLHGLGADAPSITVLGGLVPAVLAAGVELAPPHIGTADVDLLLITHVDETARLVIVETALLRMGFRAVDSDGWRWRGSVGLHPVKIEFLCDLPDFREGEFVRPPGCEHLSACNLRGTGYVALDSARQELRGTLESGAEVTVAADFAGLGGYLLSKLVAVRTRAATKDYYDFVYVLINNTAGGPAGAAQWLTDERFTTAHAALEGTFLEVRERFRRTTDFGPTQYAEQAEQANPGGDVALLRADAVSAAGDFFDSLLGGR